MARIGSIAMNLFPNMILNSPLHRIMSGKYLIIEFTGRKSHRVYRTPVAYVREGNRILLSTDSAWWRNLEHQAPVRVRIAGRYRSGTASVISQPDRAQEILRTLVDAIPSYAGPAGLARTDGAVPDSEIARAISEGRKSIVIDLDLAQ